MKKGNSISNVCIMLQLRSYDRNHFPAYKHEKRKDIHPYTIILINTHALKHMHQCIRSLLQRIKYIFSFAVDKSLFAGITLKSFFTNYHENYHEN